MKEAGKTTPGKHLKQAIQYICNPEKTKDGAMIGSLNCQSDYAYQQMIQTKKQYGKVNLRQGYHMIISFEEGEVTPEKAFTIVEAFAKEYLEKDYEAIYSIHDDTAHVHGHIIFNSVSYRTGMKYRYEKGDWRKDIQPIVNKLCEQHSLSTIDLEEEHPFVGIQSWKKSQEENKIWNQMIRRDLNYFILKARNFEEFQELMIDKGYEIKMGKYFAIKPPGMKRFRRCKSLGEDYTEERIHQRIREETLKTEQKPKIPKVYVKRYRRLPLSDLQKRYYVKLYRTGVLKKRPYSQVWKYKKEIQQFERLQKEYQLLHQYEIHNVQTLKERILVCEENRKALEKEKRALFRQRIAYKEYFQMYKRAKYLSHAVTCYQNGDEYFQKEYKEYEQIEKDLRDGGFTLEKIGEIKNYYEEQLQKIREKEKERNLEFDILKKIYFENCKYPNIEPKRKREQQITR